MVPGSDWKGKVEANSRPKSRGSGSGSEWGGFPTSLSPGRVVPHQGRALSRSPWLPRGGPPTPAHLQVAAPVAMGLSEQDIRHPRPGSWAQSAPPRISPEAWRCRNPVQGGHHQQRSGLELGPR